MATNMAVAPDPILQAGLETLRTALICCRNWTLHDDASIRQVNDLMEAIHEVPAMLMNWDGHDLSELKTHLNCFHASHWRHKMDEDEIHVPHLVTLFEQSLSEFESQE